MSVGMAAPRARYACDPDHMQLVLDRRLAPLWREIADWVTNGL